MSEYITTNLGSHVTVELPPAPPQQPDLNDPQLWWIDVGPFYDRFGAQKYPILASTDAVVQAVIKDSSVRQYIDLKRPDLAQAIDLLISKGFALDKNAILTTPTTEAERHIKGLYG